MDFMLDLLSAAVPWSSSEVGMIARAGRLQRVLSSGPEIGGCPSTVQRRIDRGDRPPSRFPVVGRGRCRAIGRSGDGSLPVQGLQ